MTNAPSPAGQDLYDDPGRWAGAVPASFRDDPAMRYVRPTTGLPRVLIIGDSISMGYTPTVQAGLTSRATVHRAPDNAASTARTIESIEAWLGANPWDVVLANWGLHDLRRIDPETGAPGGPARLVEPDRYAANLEQLLGRISGQADCLLLATTTPVPEGAAHRVAGDELAYNEILRSAAVRHAAGVLDLWAVAARLGPDDRLEANVHFTAGGYEQLGRVVADAIGAALPRVDARRSARPSSGEDAVEPPVGRDADP